MAVVIDENLAASPSSVPLPSGPIALTQTLHGRHNVEFKTPQGSSKQVQFKANIPAGATQRTDTVKLIETGGGTGLAQVQIKQTIQAETVVHDSVTLTIQS
jgi:hypothetical protein